MTFPDKPTVQVVLELPTVVEVIKYDHFGVVGLFVPEDLPVAGEGGQVGLGEVPQRAGLDDQVQVAEVSPEVRIFTNLKRFVVVVDLEKLEGAGPGRLPHLRRLDEDLDLHHAVVRQLLELLVRVDRR